MGSRVVSPQCLGKLHQLVVNFLNIYNIFWASNKQTRYWNWFFDFWTLHVRSRILEVWCDEDIMIHYNNHNNAYCWAVNAQTFETIEHNTVKITTLLYPRKPYAYIPILKYLSVLILRSEINQISPNPSRYNICCSANVYIFIGTHLVPLNCKF